MVNFQSANQVGKAALQTLELYLPAYIVRAEQLEGLEPMTLTMPKSYFTAHGEGAGRRGDAFPRVSVLVSRLASDPERFQEMDGYGYRAGWLLLAGIAIGNTTSRAETVRELSPYVAAIRACLTNQGLHEMDGQVIPMDESLDDVDAAESQFRGGGTVSFTVITDGYLSSSGPLLAPPDDPYEPWPEGVAATDAFVTVLNTFRG